MRPAAGNIQHAKDEIRDATYNIQDATHKLLVAADERLERARQHDCDGPVPRRTAALHSKCDPARRKKSGVVTVSGTGRCMNGIAKIGDQCAQLPCYTFCMLHGARRVLHVRCMVPVGSPLVACSSKACGID